MLSIQVEDGDEAFDYWYNKLSTMNMKDDSRDGKIVGEILNAITEIKDPTRCLFQNCKRKMPMRYAIGEMLWYLSGSNTLKGIQNYTSSWDRMSDNGETVNSNYGYCIMNKFDFNQWEEVKNELYTNPNSRRAVIHIKSPYDDINSKDVNCTVCLQFFIRNNKLYLTTYMRSNDLWMGFPYDVFQFTCMQIRMAMELGVDIGTYTHMAGSLHLYERNLIK